MTKKIYISPSDQTENRYAWGNTNEHAQCQRIAEAEAAALRRSGVEVKLAAFGTTMAQRCAESDAWGADIHSCVHTNAFNGKVSGTRMFCYSVPGKGYDACRAVFGQLAPLTPGTSENIQANPRLYEVRNPAAPSVYCECEFHDSIQGARWIVEHTTDIGEAIAKGLCEYLGAAYVPARQEAPKPAEPAQGDTLYRVQVGAFAVRANAENVAELRAVEDDIHAAVDVAHDGSDKQYERATHGDERVGQARRTTGRTAVADARTAIAKPTAMVEVHRAGLTATSTLTAGQLPQVTARRRTRTRVPV